MPAIQSVYPLDNALGLPLETRIIVAFDSIMDQSTINSSTFLVSGPSGDLWSGLQILRGSDVTSPENILSDFIETGYIDGTFSFDDSSGCTEVTFTSAESLRINSEYTVYLVGDEGLDTEDIIKGIDTSPLIGTYAWKFSTGSGNLQEVPADTSLAAEIPQILPTISDIFSLVTISPANRDTNLTVTTDTITIEFNRAIDSTTVDAAISVIAESVNGDTSIPDSGIIGFTSSTTSQTVTLTLTDALLENNIIDIVIAETLKDTSGYNFSGGYSSYFTTTYNPLYVTARRIRLDIGAQIASIPEDTINLAIFEASRTADIISFSGTIANQRYYDHAKRQFVICEASGILLQGIAAQTAVSAKRLGDFTVDYDGNFLPRILKRLEDCIAQWEPIVMGGGDTRDFAIGVKGLLDPNRPEVGRLWSDESNMIPGANGRESYYYRWRKTWV